MQCADVAGIGSGDDTHAGGFQKHQIVVSGRSFWRRRNVWDTTGNFGGWNLCKFRPGCDDLGIAELLLDVC